MLSLIHISVSLYVAFRVEHYYRNGVVAVDDFQHQIDVGVLVGAVKRTPVSYTHLTLAANAVMLATRRKKRNDNFFIAGLIL